MADLMEMLSFKRPAGNPYEYAFIERYIRPYGPTTDDFGNLYVEVGQKPTTLWSSHTDTVHRRGGLQEIIKSKQGYIRLAPSSLKTSDCLGADCTTGVWLMLEMIEANVPGLYVFHRAEEIGGLGSSHIAKHERDRLKNITSAIAFDRKGTNEVITHQGQKCASSEFALSLAKQLPHGFKPSVHGMFTDTKNYRKIVPECVNISVGYYSAHSKDERQDYEFALQLRDKLLTFDENLLVIKRDPTEKDAYVYGRGRYFDDFDRVPETVDDLVRMYPMTVASIMVEAGVTFELLDDKIRQRLKANQTKNKNLKPLALVSTS